MFLWMMVLPCSASGKDVQTKPGVEVPPMLASGSALRTALAPAS